MFWIAYHIPWSSLRIALCSTYLCIWDYLCPCHVSEWWQSIDLADIYLRMDITLEFQSINQLNMNNEKRINKSINMQRLSLYPKYYCHQMIVNAKCLVVALAAGLCLSLVKPIHNFSHERILMNSFFKTFRWTWAHI